MTLVLISRERVNGGDAHIELAGDHVGDHDSTSNHSLIRSAINRRRSARKSS